MADYVRVKLRWDNSDNPREYPCGKHANLGCSKCDTDFLFWIEQKYSDSYSIIDLNKALQEEQDVDKFLRNRYGKDISSLHNEYQKELLKNNIK